MCQFWNGMGLEPGLVHDIHGNLRLGGRKRLKAAEFAAILRGRRASLANVAGVPTRVTEYSREDVLRILQLGSRELQGWERAGLMPVMERYGFRELGQLRTLKQLRRGPAEVAGVRVGTGLGAALGSSRRMSPSAIRRSLDAMQRASGMRDALGEATALRRGRKLSFRHGGALVDPLTQQLEFDFDSGAGRERLRVVGQERAAQQRAAEVQELFLRAVQLEESAATIAQAAELYAEILRLRPMHAPALINLGTIRYNRREYREAEALYRRATEADPEYALAFFDLGNVLDEMQRIAEATAAYERAVKLVPRYADAHYNLALALERQGQRRRALRHWMHYVRLDPAGPWSAHARGQARKILSGEKLLIVSRGGRGVKAAG